MNRLTFVLIGALTALPALAADEDFALAFPITAPEGEPLFALDLPPEAYATLTTPDLRDLVVVDAQGREQAISLHRPPPPPPPREPLAIDLPLPIPVPGDAATTPGTLALHVRRDPDGRLGAIDLRTVDAGANAMPPEWLIDVGAAAREGVDGLRLTPDGTDDFRTLVDVRGSDDLVQWQTLQTALPLLRASNGDRAIERLDLRFARTTHRYLALRPASNAAPLPTLRQLVALRRQHADAAPLSTLALEAQGVSEDGRTIDYGRLGPLPVQQVEVRLSAGGDGIVGIQLEQQSGDRWLPLAAGTAWRIAIGGETLGSPPLSMSPHGPGPLRLKLARALPPPRLVLGYAPDRVVVLTSGEPPFRLLAGSARHRHVATPMGDALAAVRQRQGEDWQPPLAAVGPAQPLAGASALAPKADGGRIALWLVLGLGALVVGGLAWRLLRSPTAEA